MPESLTFVDLLDDAALLSLEHQLHLGEVVGDHRWDVDMHLQRFEFTGSRTITCTGFHLVGSAAVDTSSWLWGWANPSGFADSLTAAPARLRGLGQQYGIAELSEPEVPFDALPGSPDDPFLVAALLTEAAKAVTGHWTSYIGDAGGGTYVAFLVEHPEFHLPAPEAARVMTVIQEALGRGLTDHRRALHSYAVRRGLGATFTPDRAELSLTRPGFTVLATFDELGRISNISATLVGRD